MGLHDAGNAKPHLVLAAPVLHKAESSSALYDCKHANRDQDVLEGKVKQGSACRACRELV